MLQGTILRIRKIRRAMMHANSAIAFRAVRRQSGFEHELSIEISTLKRSGATTRLRSVARSLPRRCECEEKEFALGHQPCLVSAMSEVLATTGRQLSGSISAALHTDFSTQRSWPNRNRTNW